MLSILADECVDVQLVFRLRRLGYAVSTVCDFCQSKYGDGIEDRAVLELGRKHRLAVLTANESHFINLHRQCPWHHGILIIDAEADVQAQVAKNRRRIADKKPRPRSNRVANARGNQFPQPAYEERQWQFVKNGSAAVQSIFRADTLAAHTARKTAARDAGWPPG